MISFCALLLVTASFGKVLSIAKDTNELIDPIKICSLPPNPGYGDCSAEPTNKFYFDVFELKCKAFLFLNCKGGNRNRFDSEIECVRVCHYTACRSGEIIALSTNSTPVNCKSSKCPENYRCSFDKVFKRHICCGFSNLDRSCPDNSVSYASPTARSALSCSPSPSTNNCPDDSICVKKEKTGHCCRPEKDFCPIGKTPQLDALSHRPIICNTIQSFCSEGYECIDPYRGSPWGYCCSAKVTGQCPNGNVLYLDPENGQPNVCTVGVTTCRSGYSCQSINHSIVGFCCKDPRKSKNDIIHKKPTKSENQNLVTKHLADDSLTVGNHLDSSSAAHLVHTYAYDLMTVLSCPYELIPSYMANSQIIMECTKTDEITNSCPAPAKCVKAPRDVLKRSVCCSSTMPPRPSDIV
ncbi:unnamed protein product [Cylicocyclus nassatus]|uniref:BPTI/Kunitz inhibitor domain-containing protein n=1 Tax=Cylicocyclus nassatus TaxID=53992 RepID=A0AA36MEV1_CYLNA|nr:unnamed protein product [Cylicocyclus nassatus]